MKDIANNFDIDIIDNNDFTYLTGSLIFDKDYKLNYKSPSDRFYLLYHSMDNFRNIIDYLTDIFSKNEDISKKIEYAKTIDNRISNLFLTWIKNNNEYIFFDKAKQIFLSLAFNDSSVFTFPGGIKKILYSTTNDWNSTIDFFLNYENTK